VKAAKAASKRTPAKRARAPKKPFVIDFHAHIVIPEVVAFSRPYTVAAASEQTPVDARMTDEAKAAAQKWTQRARTRMADYDLRIKEMDAAGVDIQVLTQSLVVQFTYWADPHESLRMERLSNDRMAEIVSRHPDRFIGLGGVPLQSPDLAIKELERCMGELGFKGVQVSSQAGDMELGDPRLSPFWARAQELGAVIYLHPAGITDRRYQKHQLWNSIGQPLEESMAMASLFYEGVVDEFPDLKFCIAHGGGYLPYYAGRVDRNYFDKPHLQLTMTRSPTDYMKTAFYYDSCVYDPDAFAFLVDRVGADRIVLGSDYPVGEDDPVSFVRKTRGISEADCRKILSGTAAELLGLSV
jgi:aminocarboxymuconate-semialdehyde decarboxylase